MKGYVSVFMTDSMLIQTVGKWLTAHQWWNNRIKTMKYQALL